MQDAVRMATGVSDVEFSGTRGGARFGQGGPQIDLTLKPMQKLGIDGARKNYTPDPDHPNDPTKGTLEHAQFGLRLATLTIKIESNDGDPNRDSVALSARLTTRLQRKSVLAKLWEAGIALVTINPPIPASYAADGRRISACITDVILSASEWDSDDTAESAWISKVHVKSEYLIEGNTPTDRQIDVEVS